MLALSHPSSDDVGEVHQYEECGGWVNVAPGDWRRTFIIPKSDPGDTIIHLSANEKIAFQHRSVDSKDVRVILRQPFENELGYCEVKLTAVIAKGDVDLKSDAINRDAT
jgi:hypothetical protein